MNGVTCLLCSPTKSAHLIELTKPPGGVMHPMGALKLTNYILLFLRELAPQLLLCFMIYHQFFIVFFVCVCFFFATSPGLLSFSACCTFCSHGFLNFASCFPIVGYIHKLTIQITFEGLTTHSSLPLICVLSSIEN